MRQSCWAKVLIHRRLRNARRIGKFTKIEVFLWIIEFRQGGMFRKIRKGWTKSAVCRENWLIKDINFPILANKYLPLLLIAPSNSIFGGGSSSARSASVSVRSSVGAFTFTVFRLKLEGLTLKLDMNLADALANIPFEEMPLDEVPGPENFEKFN